MKDTSYKIRLTAKEREELEDRALKAGCTVAEVVRAALFPDIVPTNNVFVPTNNVFVPTNNVFVPTVTPDNVKQVAKAIQPSKPFWSNLDKSYK